MEDKSQVPRRNCDDFQWKVCALFSEQQLNYKTKWGKVSVKMEREYVFLRVIDKERDHDIGIVVFFFFIFAAHTFTDYFNVANPWKFFIGLISRWDYG